MADHIEGLQITGSDFSYNYRQRLNSDRFKEDVSDWQSYHHNDKNEWLRFGAGIYLDHCNQAVIHNNISTDGQCALMMTYCNNGKVYNNNFSFNTGVGIGMYHSSGNHILDNKIDWNVRGFSYGYYYRGQDSGGILVFDQCSNNVFAYNSVTHSGDGFFLWAGQQTIDEGTGGCNDNLVYGNDFSYAPTNGVEITFSRNKIINNKMHDCWHGIWGGFSYNTVIAKNDFGGNLAAISIEHGQDNIIEQNSFTQDSLAIELWAIPNRKADFGLMKIKDTRSRNYSISQNIFTNVPTVYSIINSQAVTLANNQYKGCRTLQKSGKILQEIQSGSHTNTYDFTADSLFIQSLKPGSKMQAAHLPHSHPQGKKNIMMTEWGPYNFRYPLLWWTSTDATGKMHFEVKGPKGKWKLKKISGAVLLSASNGKLPAVMDAQRKSKDTTNVTIELEYIGEKMISPFGKIIPAGQPYTFEYKENSLPMKWEVSWFGFDSSNDPVQHPAAFNLLLKSNSQLKKTIVNAPDYEHLHGKGLPDSKFATLVHTTIDAPKGRYRLGVTAGDMVRVYVDERLVINSWDPAVIVNDADYHTDAIVQLDGKHHIKIVQAQYGTYGMLSCTIKRMD
ncbi:MAG: right-handed parallel beta-helix repeat-containing protein [Ferruginibacter sp.]